MLDEPGLSLDPDWRRVLQAHLRGVAAAGATVLVATHLLGEWDGQADRCLVLEGGQVEREVPPTRLRDAFPFACPQPAVAGAPLMEVIMFAPARAASRSPPSGVSSRANRVNRFLHVHLALAAVAGLLPLFTPDDAPSAAPLWVLHAVLYCLSLSALLLGLSSAHGEADEFPLLFTQPVAALGVAARQGAALSRSLSRVGRCSSCRPRSPAD